MVSADALVDALWGEDPPPTARRSLQSHVAKLRAALGGDHGPAEISVTWLHPGGRRGPDRPVAKRATLCVRPARAYLGSAAGSSPRPAGPQQWTSEPLGDLADHDQLVPQRRRLDRLWLDLVELELDATLAVGDAAAAVERLEWLVLDRPEHEPFWARLMTAYYRAGRQSDALEAFQRASPSPRRSIRDRSVARAAAPRGGDPRTSRRARRSRSTACPYKGLASYQLDDADLFYGRDELVAELVEAVRSASFVVVVGSSGAGKSSALRGGPRQGDRVRQIERPASRVGHHARGRRRCGASIRCPRQSTWSSSTSSRSCSR